MGTEVVVKYLVEKVVMLFSGTLLPMIIMAFMSAICLRLLVYYTVKREMWFAREFQRRVMKVMEEMKVEDQISFYPFVKRVLERTFYESFIVRAIMKRRNPDYVMALSDRIFLIQQGSAILIKDALKQLKYLKKSDERPKFLEISKTIFQNNPCFSKVLGILPIDAANNMLNILPGLFIIGGIFGTFLGIMDGLPKLSMMDLSDTEGSKLIMDTFLLKISFSMSASITGIMVSVTTTLFNTVFAVEKVFIDMVERFENTLDMVWDRSMDNDVPVGLVEFDENKDPIDALAADALQEELKKDKSQKTNLRPWASPTLKESVKVVDGTPPNPAGDEKKDKVDKAG